jgi:uncharacterized protein YdeI (YjbR/CyaY-like superfamily)
LEPFNSACSFITKEIKMKIEIEVPDELIEKLGKEAVETYLFRKVAALDQSSRISSSEYFTAPEADKEATDTAWQIFNKRGMSC